MSMCYGVSITVSYIMCINLSHIAYHCVILCHIVCVLLCLINVCHIAWTFRTLHEHKHIRAQIHTNACYTHTTHILHTPMHTYIIQMQHTCYTHTLNTHTHYTQNTCTHASHMLHTG